MQNSFICHRVRDTETFETRKNILATRNLKYS